MANKHNARPDAVLEVSQYEVASWSPGGDGEGVPCTQVHIIVTIPIFGSLVIRLKSRVACQSLINALIEHRDFVWPQKGAH